MPFSSCYLFEGLSTSQLERLEAITHEQKTQKDQWLFREGHEAEHFYLIKEGAIELLTIAMGISIFSSTMVRSSMAPSFIR